MDDKLLSKTAEKLWNSVMEVVTSVNIAEIKKSANQKDPKLRIPYIDHKTKLCLVLDQLYEEFDKLLKDIPTTDNLYLKIAFFKGLCVSALMSNLMDFEIPKERLPYLKNTIALLEPLQLRPEIIWIYMMLNSLLVIFYKKQYSESMVGKKLIAKTMFRIVKNYEDYNRSTSTKPWNTFDHCILKMDSFQQNIIKMFFEQYTMAEAEGLYKDTLIGFLEVSVDIDDINIILERGALACKFLLKDKKRSKHFSSTVFYIKTIAMAYFKHNYLKQAMHLMAVIMCKIVEYRRSLPENTRNILNNTQAWVSFFYSLYGYVLSTMGLGLEPVPTLVHICDRIFESDELEIYEKQFPTNIVTDIKKLKSIHKKTILWLERAETLAKSAPTLDEELIGFMNDIKEELLQITLKHLSLSGHQQP